jgi:Innexin
VYLQNLTNSTFTLKIGGVKVPQTGTVLKSEQLDFHKYYQYFHFVFFPKALILNAPHFVWKHFEAGKLETLISVAKSILLMHL